MLTDLGKFPGKKKEIVFGVSRSRISINKHKNMNGKNSPLVQ